MMSSSKAKTTLSHRLQTLKDFWHDSPLIWDIGCDHGLLGLSFVENPSVKEINLVDASKRVIETLTQKLHGSYITIGKSKINILHKAGQKIQLPDSKKTIFIAGMGGKEIIDILTSLEVSIGPEDRVVISPHRKILELRSYLNSSSFRLFNEVVLEEDNQFYQILCLVKDYRLPEVTLYGHGFWSSEAGESYCAHQIKHFSEHQDERSQEYLRYLMELKSLNELS